ncbi:MAG: multifunctional oxoglutarate decarboxylase/oxoglutarate dehydrogenase thiamine pyrophosphate-binding subunit/dihydrolipoyllysine-residue succinyltransferase subunit [Candidatus Eremiobacteraeota bacterium]|nr:multifunctional oxoglutarate decarboxylase/oxoglutarate dehydrogenase thiamine pyrophosphate-binding subunit/dihydrolipoyllysine-residue succinyltransferase subunit [Candidatus Eremiobacteraeota bacterium]
MGESVAEGTVTSWRKRVGDAVSSGEPLVDVTTDKVDVEVPAPAAGTVVKIIAAEGATVKVGGPLAEIDTDGASKPVASKMTDAADSAKTPDARAASASSPPQLAPRPAPSQPPARPASRSAESEASPLARRAAALAGVDLSGIRGSGPGGVVRRADINGQSASAHAPNAAQLQTPGQPEPLARRATPTPAAPSQTPASAPQAPASPPPPTPAASAPSLPIPTGATVTPLRGAAAALVANMEDSLHIPAATSFRTISVDTLETRRQDLNAALRTAGRAEKVSFTHIIGYAIARATQQVPVMTSAFRRDGDQATRVDQPCNLGLAVDMQRKDGSRFLVVPVIRDADKLDFAAFHKTYEALVAKARAASLTPSDLSGASITLTNPGGIGTVASVPRLTAGQGAIIATGAIGYPAGLASVPESTLRSMGVAKVLTMTSTYDHRIIQGAQSGEFLRRIEGLLGGADGFYDALFASLSLPRPATVSKIETRAPGVQAPAAAPLDLLRAATAGASLVARYRTYGHTAAVLDPLGEPPAGDPALDPASLGLTLPLMEAIPASVLRIHMPGNNLAELLPRLREAYCGTIAYQMEHISGHQERGWLREQIESGAHRQPLTRETALRLLQALTSVETFERYLRKSFLGQKTFSLEGLDAMVPMLEEAVDLLAADGVGEVDLGMAHRGRLAVITHVVGRPFEEALREFETAEKRGDTDLPGDVTGDVKYHQGSEGVRQSPSGKNIRVVLAPNPSHLEAVDAVVEGRTRAAQTDRSRNIATVDANKAAALLIHGDAAFPAQGVVAEVLNMQALAGYTTGGTIHIIANNQIGFTTTPGEGRSTRYASDLAKGFDIPIIHVNADDIEACLAAVRLSVAFRKQFARDILIDLVGYRRFGHNETDEPAYTQPILYERIKNHPTVREIFARRLVERGILSEEEVNALLQDAQRRISGAHASVKAEPRQASADAAKSASNGTPAIDTRIAAPELRTIDQGLLAVPEGFTIHPKLARQLERRRTALEPGGEIDWALGEALAFGTLLLAGTPIRLTGQDTERGTFSHRHIVLHDPMTGESYAPLQHLNGARASFEVYNSPLSEYACVGFEYGYSAAAPNALVLWEAQFGDFFNGAQIIMDQFISAGQAKWGESPRLTLLLPHGYEGAGPEHSSARLERFLQLAGDNNLRIANTTTPAQYFHLLRDQALTPRARPLVMMTPKSLLRLKAASSTIADFTERGFMPVIDDPTVRDRKKITRLILCAGKIYYDLSLDPLRQAATDLAIARVELLEPFPLDDVLALVKSYPSLTTVAWVQEEPKNMGARAFVSRRLREQLVPGGIKFGYVGRPDRASPSEGYPGAHAVEQERIVRDALSQPVYKETK